MSRSDRTMTQQTLMSLLSKLNDPDPDIRFMSLDDVLKNLTSPSSEFLAGDNITSARLVDGILKALDDQHGEVQNQALKCVGPLAVRLPPETLAPLIDRLTNLTSSNTIDVSVPHAALKTLVAAVPRPDAAGATSPEALGAYNAISKVLIPRLVGYVVVPGSKSVQRLPKGMLGLNKEKGYSADAVDVLIEVVRCFGVLLKEPELTALQKAAMSIIESPQAGSVVKKRALAAVSTLLAYFTDNQLSAFVSELIESFRSPHLTLAHRKHLIATVGALARAIPAKFGPYLMTIAPFVLSAVSEKEMEDADEDEEERGEHDAEIDEVREAALVALEALLGACGPEMEPYVYEAISAALRYLKYDPNVAESDDETMGGTQDANSDDEVTDEPEDDGGQFEDFEEEEGYSDIDDQSWKVRRCAAKVLYTVVGTRASGTVLESGVLYEKVAPALISRFNKEREENVRLEVLATMTSLVRKTGEASHTTRAVGLAEAVNKSTNSRKRRRQASDASMYDLELSALPSSEVSTPAGPASPPAGPQTDLGRLTPSMVQGLTRMWKSATIPLKQAAIVLLRSLALVRSGGLSDFLQQIEDPIADALKPSNSTLGTSAMSNLASASGGSLQIETLILISVIAETHPSNVLLPFVIALIPAVVTTVRDRNFKVSSEALGAIEQMVKSLTPPRDVANDQDHANQLGQLYDVILNRVTDNNADLEVRHRAIQVFGVLLARTSGERGTKLLSPTQRSQGLQVLCDRLKNETTRLSAARAVENIASHASRTEDVGASWVTDISLELGTQLRKSDRALRSSCLEALRSLAVNPNTQGHFDKKTIEKLASMLLPLLSASDLHLLHPALVICAKIIPTGPQKLVNSDLVSALCTVVLASLAGSVLRAFLLLVKTIGEQGVGAPLMQGLLGVGVGGDTTVVGKAIGTLVVYGSSEIGVAVPDFLKELDTAQDDQRKCLALAILGEVGFRQGTKSTMDPDVFAKHFSSKSDKVRISAAIAMGSAGATNIKQYLPPILTGLGKSSSSDYLLLHALKEILQHPDMVRQEVAPFAKELWEKLIAASNVEDNRAVGAECIGRLALIEPKTYLAQLQTYLTDSNPVVRGTVISAFRYTLTDTSSTYTDVLKGLITSFLTTMLSDNDLGNQRVAVTTLNSAIHNKIDLVLPQMNQLLPPIMQGTHVNPALIRTVSYGPFKIPIDDGLDVRKSCYETIYACLELAFSRLDVVQVYDRIVAGIDDDADIRTLCNLMISKLITLDADETMRRLNFIAEKFRTVLAAKPKENSVKQEIEKIQEAAMNVLRITHELDTAFPAAQTSADHSQWKAYLDYTRKDFHQQLRIIEEETRA